MRACGALSGWTRVSLSRLGLPMGLAKILTPLNRTNPWLGAPRADTSLPGKWQVLRARLSAF